jgi:hypothetical protein
LTSLRLQALPASINAIEMYFHRVGIFMV